ncbi:MAG: DNA repair protein RadC [Clostridia bacterium]|nr:DNA repair protein RadC [Clostridia bacterium]
MEHDGHRKRIRERFAKDRFESFHPHEILELVLTYALPRQDTNPLAHRLLDHFGSLHAVLEADIHELMQVKGVGENTATLLSMLLPLMRRYEQSKLTAKRLLYNYQALNELCISLYHGITNERFYVLSLNSQFELLGIDMIAEGTPNQVNVYPRTIMEALLRRNATAAVLVHNHPGGGSMPSQQDVNTTEIVANLLSTLDIQLYDHILVADSMAHSLKNMGYLSWDDSSNTVPLVATGRNHMPPQTKLKKK